ncbi:MAG TPA: hypothetical protein VK936_06125 [Longimicrobiales bacterium]|nr:hypothetical protein [Longimicrobiales bacterium]
MHGPRLIPALLTALMLPCAGPVMAQPAPLPASVPVAADVGPAPPPEAAALQAAGPSIKTRVGRMFTGAVVGGWLGYFVSHVAVSDWENRSGLTSYRRTWTVGGVLLGVVAGHLVSPGGRPVEMQPTLAATRKRIERDEILQSGAVDAYELVRSLRKEWLIPRGVNSFRETARGTAGFDQPLTVTPGADHILVYLDNARLGGTQHLAEVTLDNIGRIEFIDGPEAVFRWGTGHVHGVILLRSLPLPPGER